MADGKRLLSSSSFQTTTALLQNKRKRYKSLQQSPVLFPCLSPGFPSIPASMFTHHPQSHQQHDQKLPWQEAPIGQSTAQSLTDFSALPGFGMDPWQTNPNLFGNFDPFNGLDSIAVHGQVGGGGTSRDPSKLRKRVREEVDQEEEEDMVASTSAKSNPLMGSNHQHVLSAPSSNPQSRAARPAPPPSYPSLCCPENPDSDVYMRMEKELLELDLFISAQVERARAEVEQTRRRLWVGVVGAVEDRIRRVLNAKDDEIASVARSNLALEQRINVLALEGQMWKALARTSEATVVALRRDIGLALKAAVAAGGGGNAPFNGAGCGREVEDSISCCEGRNGEEGEGEGGDSLRRRCRVCSTGEVTRLVLPCRHLCLCSGCDSATESCPLCGCQKKASINVNLSS